MAARSLPDGVSYWPIEWLRAVDCDMATVGFNHHVNFYSPKIEKKLAVKVFSPQLFRAKSAQIRQSVPDSGPGFTLDVLKTF